RSGHPYLHLTRPGGAGDRVPVLRLGRARPVDPDGPDRAGPPGAAAGGRAAPAPARGPVHRTRRRLLPVGGATRGREHRRGGPGGGGPAPGGGEGQRLPARGRRTLTATGLLRGDRGRDRNRGPAAGRGGGRRTPLTTVRSADHGL